MIPVIGNGTAAPFVKSIPMITRRTAILIATVPAWGFASKEFWNEKKPADWTEDEVNQMLTKSPWAKEASVSYGIAQGSNAGRSGRMTGGGMSGRTMGGSRSTGSATASNGASTGPNISGKDKALVRWESALPIREAAHTKMTTDLEQNYVLSLSGDLPVMGPRAEDEEGERERKVEMLKQYTKLDKKDPIFLSNAIVQRSATWFYFLRNDLLTEKDRQVTFVTKLGPIDVKVKFNLKEMLYQGKLEL